MQYSKGQGYIEQEIGPVASPTHNDLIFYNDTANRHLAFAQGSLGLDERKRRKKRKKGRKKDLSAKTNGEWVKRRQETS